MDGVAFVCLHGSAVMPLLFVIHVFMCCVFDHV